MIRRIPIEDDPSVDIGLLTGPAGRCGELVSRTCQRETNQELMILTEQEIIGFYRQGDDLGEIIQQKMEQVKRKIAQIVDLPKQNRIHAQKEIENDQIIKILQRIKTKDQVRMLNIAELTQESENLDQISMTSGGIELDRIKNGLGVLDPKTNTFEVREILHLPDNINVDYVIDGEEYNREIVTVESLREIEKDVVVPALDYYRNRIKDR